MEKKRFSVAALAPAIVSLLLAIGSSTVFSACAMKDDGTWMHCHDAQMAVMGCAVAATIVLGAAAFVKNGKVQAALYAIGAAISAVTFFIPGTIVGMCMMQTMRCYVMLQPFTRIMSAVVFVLCAVMTVRAYRAAMKAPAQARPVGQPSRHSRDRA